MGADEWQTWLILTSLLATLTLIVAVGTLLFGRSGHARRGPDDASPAGAHVHGGSEGGTAAAPAASTACPTGDDGGGC